MNRSVSSSVPEAHLRRYLLGQLPPKEVDAVEEQLFGRAGVFQLAEIVEDELIEDYVRGLLSPENHRSFERDYLCTEGRRTKVKAIRALVEQSRQWSAENHRERNVLAIPRRTKPKTTVAWWVIGAAAAMMAVIAGISLEDLATRSGQGPSRSEGQQINSSATPGALEETIALQPSSRVAEQVRPRDGARLILQLTIPHDVRQARAYRVQLATKSGETLWTTEVLPSALAASVDVTLPAEVTRPGAFSVRLINADGVGNPQEATYAFEISR